MISDILYILAMNNIVNNRAVVTTKKNNLPSREFIRIKNSLLEDPDDIMSSSANRLKIYSHFIHFVEEGGIA